MTKIRIKDIAEIANVSIGTVDRVIHNRGEVSETTRERIRKLLEEHNYKPDINASSLALKKPIRLAVVMPGVVNEHTFWKLPQSGIRRALEELAHYNISVDTFYFNQFDRNDFIRCKKEFPYNQVQGVLFAPVFHDESVSFLNQCEEVKLPVVLFNSLLDVPSIRSFVGQDAFHSGYVAAKLIYYGMESGRDVAIINMSARTDHYTHIVNREMGFRSYFDEHSDRVNQLFTLDLNGADDCKLKDQLLEACSEHDLAGLFVTNSRVYKVAEFLAQQGSMSVRLVGYDLLPQSINYLKRDYIDFLISQKPEEQAFRGLSSLFYLVAFHREPEARQMLPIDIITRENLSYYQPKFHI
ncbi:MAG: LacI family DNA-binding transcriptional regulator [Bacteroidales bacterium]|nr:LacI family DNA-binding transcriptional regulator [Bacteroidales bacterium]